MSIFTDFLTRHAAKKWHTRFWYCTIDFLRTGTNYRKIRQMVKTKQETLFGLTERTFYIRIELVVWNQFSTYLSRFIKIFLVIGGLEIRGKWILSEYWTFIRLSQTKFLNISNFSSATGSCWSSDSLRERRTLRTHPKNLLATEMLL